MTRCLLVCALVLSASEVSAQSNPCTLDISTRSVNPSTVYVEHATFLQNFPDGSPVIASVQIGAFLPGVDPNTTGAQPVSSVTVARSEFTAVGTHAPGCYQTRLAQPLAVPVATIHAAVVRGVNPQGAAAWVVGNPFYVAGAPSGFSSVRAQ